ncbi:hypothetical protein [Actinacidiphila guanduensis]|nr:hypothetical protein [Actinacidiphila guanduensis]
MQADLQAAVKGYMAQNELTPPFTVTSDGSKDISCGKGKARRVYTTMQRRTGKGVTDPGFMLGEVESLAGFLDQSKVYVPGSRTEKDQGPVTVSEKATSSRHHARALITGKADSGAFVLVLESTTDCLRTS